MDENKKDNALEELNEELENTEAPEETGDVTEAEAEAYDASEPKLEENDNWEFEAEAMTLKNTVIEDGQIEIEIPERPVSETRERPKAVKQDAAPAQPKERKDSKNLTKFLITAILGVIVIGVLTFFGIRYYTLPNNMEKMNPGNVAMTVGDEKVSIGMYNYYFLNTVNTYKSQAQYGYVDLDIYTDFAKQETTDDDGNTITWAERFENETQDQIKQVVAYYEAAKDSGETLTDAQEEQIKSSLEQLKSAADEAGQSVDAYISEKYGDYCGYTTLEKMIRMSYLAQNYLVKQSVTVNPTEEEIQAYADAHTDEYLSADIAYLILPYTDDTKETVMASATDYAAQIHSLDDMKAVLPEACAELVQNYVDMGYFGSAEECIAEIEQEMEMNVSAQTGFPQEALDWVLSDDNGVGACTAIASDDNGCALIVLKTGEASLPEDRLYTVRHILIMPDTGEEEGTEQTEQAPATEEQMAAAKAKAEEVYKEYQDGEQTEARFAELAEEYSQDPGSTMEQAGVYGGIYENVAAGRMVPSFENWALDESRQYGDTEIVESDYGYHIMYFVYSGPSYLAYSRTAVINEKQDDFVDSVKVKLHKGVLKNAEKAEPESAADQQTQE